MADLGNLYFDILFRDKTAEQRKKLKAEPKTCRQNLMWVLTRRSWLVI